MSIGNHNWVCFNCRVAVQQAAIAKDIPKCPRCAADCYCLDDATEIPRESDAPGWRRLLLDCRKQHLARSNREVIMIDDQGRIKKYIPGST